MEENGSDLGGPGFFYLRFKRRGKRRVASCDVWRTKFSFVVTCSSSVWWPRPVNRWTYDCTLEDGFVKNRECCYHRGWRHDPVGMWWFSVSSIHSVWQQSKLVRYSSIRRNDNSLEQRIIRLVWCSMSYDSRVKGDNFVWWYDRSLSHPHFIEFLGKTVSSLDQTKHTGKTKKPKKPKINRKNGSKVGGHERSLRDWGLLSTSKSWFVLASASNGGGRQPPAPPPSRDCAVWRDECGYGKKWLFWLWLPRESGREFEVRGTRSGTPSTQNSRRVPDWAERDRSLPRKKLDQDQTQTRRSLLTFSLSYSSFLFRFVPGGFPFGSFFFFFFNYHQHLTYYYGERVVARSILSFPLYKLVSPDIFPERVCPRSRKPPCREWQYI